MDKLKKAKELLDEAVDLFPADGENSNDLFIRGELQRARKRIEDRIKALNDARMLSEPADKSKEPADKSKKKK